jgi:hypothetical protein
MNIVTFKISNFYKKYILNIYYIMSNRSEEQKLQEVYIMPSYMKYFYVSVLCILFIAIFAIIVYKYSLVTKSINRKDYTTALALSAPELSLGISSLSAYLL